MSLLTTLKTAYSPRRYWQSSMRVIEGMGYKGTKPRPFNYELAMRKFHSWAYAAAQLNANAVASVPKRLYVRRQNGEKLYGTRPISKKLRKYLTGDMASVQPSSAVMAKAVEYGGDVEEVLDPHPILTVWKSANAWSNGYEYDVLQMLDLQFSGNAYFHPIIDRSTDMPMSVWRMPPQWTQVIPDVDSFIKGYLYGRTQDTSKKFEPDEVDHYKMPNPRDLFYGAGWVEAAWTSLGLHESKREMDMARADNMARPDWMMTLKSGASPDTLDRIEKRLQEKFRGSDRQGQFIVVPGDSDVKPLQWEEKEWGAGTRIIEEIAAVSGVPVAMLLSNDPNRANSENARLGWYRNTVRQYCKLIEEKFNERWVSRFHEAEDVFVAYDPVCFEDEQAMAKQLVGYVAGGILTQNEARCEIGYPEQEDGDVLFPPVGGAGISATAGDQAPNQNDDRQNESPTSEG